MLNGIIRRLFHALKRSVAPVNGRSKNDVTQAFILMSKYIYHTDYYHLQYFILQHILLEFQLVCIILLAKSGGRIKSSYWGVSKHIPRRMPEV